MDEDGALYDARFDDGGPFRDTPEPGGISLDSALRDFGPAALDDLIPRVRVLASVLDAAHARGVVHGALNPSKIIITDDGTSIVKGGSSAPPYIAPEAAAGETPGPAADQFSLAAITYEWLFGKRVEGPAHRPVSVKAMPDVDRAALAKAFSRALAAAPEARFASCVEFCDAVAASTMPALPLAIADAPADGVDSVGPFISETPEVQQQPDAWADVVTTTPNADAMKIVAEETNLTAAQPDLDAIVPPPDSRPDAALPDRDGPFATEREDALLDGLDSAAVSAWNPSTVASSSHSNRFSGAALIVAAIVGAIFGFAGGYMARPRALQSGSADTFATPPVPPAAADKADARATPPVTRPESPVSPAPAAAPPSSAASAKAPAAKTGRLLVRSNPSGATVSVDGVEKGVTPLTLRDVEFGTRNLTISYGGYATETRRVVVNSAQPSRSLDVRLAARPASQRPAAPSAAPRPSTPATLGKPALTTGALVVDSRPAGASVAINGTPSGTTPLTIENLAPGEYRITMTLPGYRNFAATVRVVAGERVRAAYSLTAQEQE